MTALIVHGGAGVHSVSSESEVKAALLAACSRASTSTSALDAVENAIAFLEDATVFNAGCGSNLTLQGTVEGDAAIMDGLTGDFASVGAVSGIKNPISLARCILEHSRTPDPLGRVPPLTLVSMGAQAFARQSAPHLLVPPESMITQRTQKQWETWKDRLAAASDGADMIQDTVGAVAWHEASGEIASGVSSGGILLKYPGRIGEAAVFGAGCWAQAATRGRRMACSVSGTGEYIIKTSLARSFSAAFNDGTQDPDVHAIIERVLVDEFWIPTRSASNPDPSAGVILLTTEQDDEGRERARLWCGFTTSSFAIAYSSRSRAKAYVLRRPKAIESRPNDHPRVFVTAFAL